MCRLCTRGPVLRHATCRRARADRGGAPPARGVLGRAGGAGPLHLPFRWQRADGHAAARARVHTRRPRPRLRPRAAERPGRLGQCRAARSLLPRRRGRALRHRFERQAGLRQRRRRPPHCVRAAAAGRRGRRRGGRRGCGGCGQVRSRVMAVGRSLCRARAPFRQPGGHDGARAGRPRGGRDRRTRRPAHRLCGGARRRRRPHGAARAGRLRGLRHGAACAARRVRCPGGLRHSGRHSGRGEGRVAASPRAAGHQGGLPSTARGVRPLRPGRGGGGGGRRQRRTARATRHGCGCGRPAPLSAARDGGGLRAVCGRVLPLPSLPAGRREAFSHPARLRARVPRSRGRAPAAGELPRLRLCRVRLSRCARGCAARAHTLRSRRALRGTGAGGAVRRCDRRARTGGQLPARTHAASARAPAGEGARYVFFNNSSFSYEWRGFWLACMHI
ncbi:hypothetical protein T492DRAFT_287156 [Pavlovales sp. CCMP2436]|nr:hypothetical protein T492DRAFT_287156 [Pavlovales sp. CCMP2436]